MPFLRMTPDSTGDEHQRDYQLELNRYQLLKTHNHEDLTGCLCGSVAAVGRLRRYVAEEESKLVVRRPGRSQPPATTKEITTAGARRCPTRIRPVPRQCLSGAKRRQRLSRTRPLPTLSGRRPLCSNLACAMLAGRRSSCFNPHRCSGSSTHSLRERQATPDPVGASARRTERRPRPTGHPVIGICCSSLNSLVEDKHDQRRLQNGGESLLGHPLPSTQPATSGRSPRAAGQPSRHGITARPAASVAVPGSTLS